MRIFGFSLIATLTLCATLAGCSGGAPGSNNSVPSGAAERPANGAVPTVRLPDKLLQAAIARHNRRRPHKVRRQSADSNSQWVVFCQQNDDDCGVATPQAPGTLVATLNGLSTPEGTAVGPFSGYWYVANYGANNIPYFANDISGNPFAVVGTSPLPNPIPDPNEHPDDVAVRETGKNGVLKSTTLAVSNFLGYSSLGSVTVFQTRGSQYSSYNLTDSKVSTGIGIAFDNQGDCFWSYNTANGFGPGYIDEFKKCQGKPKQLAGITLGFAGGLAFDGQDNLWYVDQAGYGSQPAGVYECTLLSKCTLRFGPPDVDFIDPTLVNFDTSFTNLYVADYGDGIYQCGTGSSGSCAELVTASNPFGVAVNAVQAAGDVAPSPSPTPTAAPLTPQNLWDAYNLGANGPEGGAGSVVVIVEAGPNGTVASDMAAFRTKFNLNPASPATAPPFLVFDEDGRPRTPSGTATVNTHSSGTTQMAAATCPKCTIYLVEANTWGLVDMYEAFEIGKIKIITPGALSNSWTVLETAKYLKNTTLKQLGPNKFTLEYVYSDYWKDKEFKAPRPILAAVGNYGYNRCARNGHDVVAGVCYPASSASVIGVGGTALTMNSLHASARNWSEQVASFASSGCSAVISRPGWQPIATWTQCGAYGSGRNVGDISSAAVNVGVIVNGTYVAWNGTSFATPAIAALFAAAGNKHAKTAESFYTNGVKHSINTFNVQSGNNDYDGNCIPGADTYLCDAKKSITFAYPNLNDYNGPTGWGTPDGLAIFKY
jgi:hypothetical protein